MRRQACASKKRESRKRTSRRRPFDLSFDRTVRWRQVQLQVSLPSTHENQMRVCAGHQSKVDLEKSSKRTLKTLKSSLTSSRKSILRLET